MDHACYSYNAYLVLQHNVVIHEEASGRNDRIEMRRNCQCVWLAHCGVEVQRRRW